MMLSNLVANIFEDTWDTLVSWYSAYENFIYSFAPGSLGSLLIFLLNIIIIIFILKVLSSGFKKD